MRRRIKHDHAKLRIKFAEQSGLQGVNCNDLLHESRCGSSFNRRAFNWLNPTSCSRPWARASTRIRGNTPEAVLRHLRLGLSELILQLSAGRRTTNGSTCTQVTRLSKQGPPPGCSAAMASVEAFGYIGNRTEATQFAIATARASFWGRISNPFRPHAMKRSPITFMYSIPCVPWRTPFGQGLRPESCNTEFSCAAEPASPGGTLELISRLKSTSPASAATIC